MSETPTPAEPRDLGFGTEAAPTGGTRLVRRDGSFNVVRRGFGWLQSLHLYHLLLTMGWGRFVLCTLGAYLLMNAAFAAVYLLLGTGSLRGPSPTSLGARFLHDFFFSVQTSSTIGYGHIAPLGLASNVVVTLESFVGLLGFALVTGLVFARFARPVATIHYSRHALVAPYRGGRGFMIRVVNGRNHPLIEMRAQLAYTWRAYRDGEWVREVRPLRLERDDIAFFALSWTLVHPIDEESPLWGETAESLREKDAEFLVQFTATDETFSQGVSSRSSYRAEDMIWGARFVRMFERPEGEGPFVLHGDRLDEIERVESD